MLKFYGFALVQSCASMLLLVIAAEIVYICVGHQVHRASLCALDVETF